MTARNRYFMPMGRMNDAGAHHAPERTAYRAGRGIFDDYEFRVWSNRAAMLQACRMGTAWRPLVKA